MEMTMLVEVRLTIFSSMMVHFSTRCVVVDLKRLLDMHGYLGAGFDVDSGESLAIHLVHPRGHILHTRAQNAAHGLITGDPDRAEHVAVAAGDEGCVPAARLDERGGTRAGSGNQHLCGEI